MNDGNEQNCKKESLLRRTWLWNGFIGAIVGACWVIAWIVFSTTFPESVLAKFLKSINGFVVYATVERFFNFLVELGLVNMHNAVVYFLLVGTFFVSIGFICGIGLYLLISWRRQHTTISTD